MGILSPFDVVNPFQISPVTLICNVCAHLDLYSEGLNKESTKPCSNCRAGTMSYRKLSEKRRNGENESKVNKPQQQNKNYFQQNQQPQHQQNSNNKNHIFSKHKSSPNTKGNRQTTMFLQSSLKMAPPPSDSKYWQQLQMQFLGKTKM